MRFGMTSPPRKWLRSLSYWLDLADDLDFDPMFGRSYGKVLDQASQDL
jgi:hypothetical protein